MPRRGGLNYLAYRIPRLSRRVRALGSKKIFFGHVRGAAFGRFSSSLHLLAE